MPDSANLIGDPVLTKVGVGATVCPDCGTYFVHFGPKVSGVIGRCSAIVDNYPCAAAQVAIEPSDLYKVADMLDQVAYIMYQPTKQKKMTDFE